MFRDLPVSTVEGPRHETPRRGRLTQHPWRAFLVLLALQGACFTLVGVILFGILRLPSQLANIEAFSTATLFTVSALLGYGIAPFLLGLPKGRHGFRGYLDDVRIAVARPFGQVLWAFLFGLFYGYIFVRSGSLLPSMVIHWLSNVFQDPLGANFATASAGVRAFYGVTFGYGIPTLLLIPWVKFFADRWLPGGPARGTT